MFATISSCCRRDVTAKINECFCGKEVKPQPTVSFNQPERQAANVCWVEAVSRSTLTVSHKTAEEHERKPNVSIFLCTEASCPHVLKTKHSSRRHFQSRVAVKSRTHSANMTSRLMLSDEWTAGAGKLSDHWLFDTAGLLPLALHPPYTSPPLFT